LDCASFFEKEIEFVWIMLSLLIVEPQLVLIMFSFLVEENELVWIVLPFLVEEDKIFGLFFFCLLKN
jgi:hypothetical protein